MKQISKNKNQIIYAINAHGHRDIYLSIFVNQFNGYAIYLLYIHDGFIGDFPNIYKDTFIQAATQLINEVETYSKPYFYSMFDILKHRDVAKEYEHFINYFGV